MKQRPDEFSMDLNKAMNDLDYRMGINKNMRSSSETGFFESSMSASMQFKLVKEKSKCKKEERGSPLDGKKIKQYVLKKPTYVDYKGIEFEETDITKKFKQAAMKH
jgi:hypothetical protein